MFLNLELIGLFLSFVGSLFLLQEALQTRMKGTEARIKIDTRSPEKQRWIRAIGIGLITVGFFLQMAAIDMRS